MQSIKLWRPPPSSSSGKAFDILVLSLIFDALSSPISLARQSRTACIASSMLMASAAKAKTLAGGLRAGFFGFFGFFFGGFLGGFGFVLSYLLARHLFHGVRSVGRYCLFGACS